MSTKPRTPKHFPRMKHRAAKRRAFYRIIIMPDLSGFIEAVNRAAGSLATLSHGWKVEEFLIDAPPYWDTPTQPTTEAAPNRAASFMPGDIVTVNNPGSSLHGMPGRVRHSMDDPARVARIDFGDMHSRLVRHEHLTKGE